MSPKVAKENPFLSREKLALDPRVNWKSCFLKTLWEKGGKWKKKKNLCKAKEMTYTVKAPSFSSLKSN